MTSIVYPVGCSEASNPGGEVDDIAAGVVNDTPLVEEAPTPEAERAYGVREK